MTTSFYNTINLSGAAFDSSNAKAYSQELLIQKIFENNPLARLSPSQVQRICEERFKKVAPLTSWRRALTNLSSFRHHHFLLKSGEMVEGLFGYDEHLWQKNLLVAGLNNLEQQKLFEL